MALAGSPIISLDQQASIRTPEDLAEQTLKTMQSAMDSKAKEDQIFTSRLVKARYAMIDRIGSGGFGSIFKAYDTEKHVDVAIKVEKRQGKCYLDKEVLFYATLERYRRPEANRAAPRCHFSGVEGGFKIAVFDLMGESLSDLFYRCGRRFSLKCVLMLAQQLISRLESVHEAGIVHRDVKPGNFVMGRGAEAGNVYVIDFGLSNLWRCAGKHIGFNTESPFRGTHRYASVNAHNKFEQSRRDDLEAIAYVLVYFLKGGLPWQSLKVSRNKRRKAIGKFKASISPELLCAGLPIQFTQFLIYVKALAFDQTPDYEYCRSLFRSAFEEHMFEDNGVWDWDLLPATVQPQVLPTHPLPASSHTSVHPTQSQASVLGNTHRRTHPDLKQPGHPMTHQQAQALHQQQQQQQQHGIQHMQSPHNAPSMPSGTRLHHIVASPQSLTAASQLQAAHHRAHHQRPHHPHPHQHPHHQHHQQVGHHSHLPHSNAGRVPQQQQHSPPHLMSSMLPLLSSGGASSLVMSGASGEGRMIASDASASSSTSPLRRLPTGEYHSSSTSVMSPNCQISHMPPARVKLDSLRTANPVTRPNVNLLPQARISIVNNTFANSGVVAAAKTSSAPQFQPHSQRPQQQFSQQPTHQSSIWSFLSSNRAASPVLNGISIGESSSTSCVMSNGNMQGSTVSPPSAIAALSSSNSAIPRSPSPHQQHHCSSTNTHSSIIEVDSEEMVPYGGAHSNSSLRSSSNTISFATAGTSIGGSGSHSSASNSVTYPINEASSGPSSNPESPVPMMPTALDHSLVWSPLEHTMVGCPFGHSAAGFGTLNSASTDSAPSSEGLFPSTHGSSSPQHQLRGAAKKRAKAAAAIGSNPLPDPFSPARRSARLQGRQ